MSLSKRNMGIFCLVLAGASACAWANAQGPQLLEVEPFAELPAGMPAPNGLVFAGNGDLYVSDSFQGALYRIANATVCKPCALEVLSRDPLSATAGSLPFGASGLALIANQGRARQCRTTLSNL